MLPLAGSDVLIVDKKSLLVANGPLPAMGIVLNLLMVNTHMFLSNNNSIS